MNESTQVKKKALLPLSVAALGVVYGDIGTSPLYAFRQSMHGLPIHLTQVLGVLSLIFWVLIVIISIKYLVILLRADNNGEGGILALLALLKRTNTGHGVFYLILGILGAGLVLGDGMLTPAISVLSAIEGIHVVFPGFSNMVLPLTVVILMVLFFTQSLGTEKIGKVFGPILLLWFLSLGVMGVLNVADNPTVLRAIDPRYAVAFFHQMSWSGYAVLGGVFLVVTGGEALYADLGHFGKRPIRLSWFLLVLPSLLLNYFGQGAYVLAHPEAMLNPFYLMIPQKVVLPMLCLATLATIIASQAVISATFSITKQAILLGLYPRIRIVQTSAYTQGQIYIPSMNRMLMMGTLSLILVFRHSSALTDAYGVAVNLVMLITGLLLFCWMMKKEHWQRLWIVGVFVLFALVDMAFLGANLQKLDHGGWIPIAFALLCAVMMWTWYKGRTYLYQHYAVKQGTMHQLLKPFDLQKETVIPQMTVIFITDYYDKNGGNGLQFFKKNHMVPEHVVIVDHVVHPVPYLSSSLRFHVKCLNENVCKVTLQYGFMDTISIPQSLYVLNDRGLLPFSIDVDTVTYFIEMTTVIPSHQTTSMRFYWQKKVFAYLVRNAAANLDVDFYQLPHDRTVAMGTYYLF